MHTETTVIESSNRQEDINSTKWVVCGWDGGEVMVQDVVEREEEVGRVRGRSVVRSVARRARTRPGSSSGTCSCTGPPRRTLAARSPDCSTAETLPMKAAKRLAGELGRRTHQLAAVHALRGHVALASLRAEDAPRRIGVAEVRRRTHVNLKHSVV